jgi:transposase
MLAEAGTLALPVNFCSSAPSSYLEGTDNELANYGYNRNKKQGKNQIVIGLLTDIYGAPVAVQVFEGNTADTITFSEQISILAKQFLVQRITLVGDEEMWHGPKIRDLTAVKYNYITAISKYESCVLLSNGLI